MPTCPAGHISAAHDHCAVCGLRTPVLRPPGWAGAVAAAPAVPAPAAPVAAVPDEPCPRCGTLRAGRFCEECGHDFSLTDSTVASSLPLPSLPAFPGEGVPGGRATPEDRPPEPSTPTGAWRAVVAADPAYHQAMADHGILDPELIRFPVQAPRRRIPLIKERVRIGRRSVSRGILPEIDLGGPPEDPAVSHLHAILLARPGDAWALVDPGSTNGTTINGTDNPITPNVPVPLSEGDRIYVGAWTVITVQRG